MKEPLAKRFSPTQFFLFCLSCFVLIALIVILQLMNQPWLGVRFVQDSINPGSNGIDIRAVDKSGPAAGLLAPGEIVIRITGENSQFVQLNKHILQAPDVFSTYAQFNHFLQIQQRIMEILAGDAVTFQLTSGKSVTVKPASKYPLRAIPTLSLAYILAGFFCAGVGLLLLYYRGGLFVCYLVLTAGIGTLIYYLSVVLQQRELALPATWMQMTAATSIVGTNLFVWGYLSIFVIYPLRIASIKLIWFLLTFTVLIMLNSILQWLELPLHAYMLQFPLVGFGVYFLLLLQWRATQKHPVEHATVRLFIMTMAVPTVIVLLLWLIPTIFGEKVWLFHEVARFVFVPIAIGWAIAIFRYHLFNVEWWWAIGLVWLLGIAVVFVPYSIFAYIFHFDPLVALSLSVITGGILFFPIEQKLMLGAWRAMPDLADNTLPDMAQSLHKATTDKDFPKAWHQTLEKRFQPISIEHLPDRCKQAVFNNDGVTLAVPDMTGQGSFVLTGKQQGNWLFNERDVQLAQSLYELTCSILRATHAREEATLAERKRIMRDLHDSLGAKLLAMVQRCHGQPGADDAREALQTLRDTVHLSVAQEPMALTQLLGEWRTETRERLEVADVHLHWELIDMEDDLMVSSSHILLLLGFLRETVSNALKHAQPSNVFVEVRHSGEWLICNVENDGRVTTPEEWRMGFGLSHLKERFARADGKIEIFRKQVAGGQLVIQVQASLPTSAS